jgi:hypothetical protein
MIDRCNTMLGRSEYVVERPLSGKLQRRLGVVNVRGKPDDIEVRKKPSQYLLERIYAWSENGPVLWRISAHREVEIVLFLGRQVGR